MIIIFDINILEENIDIYNKKKRRNINYGNGEFVN